MEALHRFFGFRLIDQKTDVSFRGALTNHSNVDIGNGAEYTAGNIRPPPDLLSYQTNQCLVIFPSHIRKALKFIRNRGQGCGRTHQD